MNCRILSPAFMFPRCRTTGRLPRLRRTGVNRACRRLAGASTALLLLSAVLIRDNAAAQITLSGGTETHLLRAAPTSSPRALNNGRPTFGWRTDLFMLGTVSEKVSALCDVRVDDDQTVNFDYLAIRLTDLTALRLNLQAGKFDLPFGNLGERRFPRRNPLFGLPLIYEYNTALPSEISSAGAILAGRGRGGGMPLLSGGLYDLGAMVDGSAGVIGYAFALTSGTVSSTSAYGSANFNSDPGKTVRIAAVPFTGLIIGAAYSWGGYLEEYDAPPGTDQINPADYQQKAAEADLEFSRGHLVLDGEAVYSSWQVPLYNRDEEFRLFGYYLEGKFTVMPRLYLALRVSGLQFGKAELGHVLQRWDSNVTEWEGGAGYFLDKDVLLKIVRRETRTYGGTSPRDNLTVVQLVVAY